MNNIENINSLLYSSWLYKILWIKRNENITLFIEYTENSKIICLDLSITESAYLNTNFELLVEKLENFLYIYNNYSNNTFKNIWFWFFELNWNKYWNSIYIFNWKTEAIWYKQIKSIWMNKDEYWNILNFYRINASLENKIIKKHKEKECIYNNNETENLIQENFNIIYKIVENEDLSVRNLMKHFNQPTSREIFGILKENEVFEIDKLNHNNKYYFIDRLNNIEIWYFEKYKRIIEK